MRSIKWRFVLIYFLLVLAVLLIVSTSIIGRLDSTLTNDRIMSVKNQINSLLSSSSYFSGELLDENIRGIKASLNERRFSDTDDIFVLSSEDFETIIASKTDDLSTYDGQYAYNIEELNVALIKEGYAGIEKSIILENYETGIRSAHLVVPITGVDNKVKGLCYAIINLDVITKTLQSAKRIIFDSGLIALLITIILSYFIASGITGPIRQVTDVSKKMSEGDFNQRVEVKSNDEIGQLSSMFNQMAVELKNNIQRTELERAKLNTIFNQMIEGVVAVDKFGKIIHINEKGRKLFGVKEDMPLSDIELNLKTLGLSSVNFQNPFTLAGEADFVLNDKNYRILYAPFEDKDLNVGGVIAVYQDMTKERKLEDMRREFVANVSHELKTPITSIKSYAETLMKYPVDDETAKSFLTVIDNESDRMAHIVRDLLILTTLDYKTEEKKLSPVSINELSHSAVERMKLMAKEKNMSIYERYEDSLSVLADEEDLLQVIINLISNAVKYTPDGGVINVSTSTDGIYNYVSVSDNGVGIKPEDQKRIFDRFYRVEKSRSRALGGTGLGLAIAKEMVNSMNGDIRVESDGRNGSTFTLKFKAVKDNGEA